MLEKNNTLILFGRSLFINKIKDKIPELCKKYHTMGCNYFVDTFPEVKYVIFYDDICPNFNDNHKVIYNATRIRGVARDKLLNHKNKDAYICRGKWYKEFEEHLNHRCLNFYFHTPSIALNWAWLHGFKNVVIVGIDLNKNSKHFDCKTAPDNAVCNWKDADIEKGKEHLKFVNEKYLNVYQLNPESDIDIPKIDIEELLNV